MSLTKSRTYMNWVDVSVTPAGGDPIVILSVTGVAVNKGSKLKPFYGDNRYMPRVLAPVEGERGISIMSGDLAAILTIQDRTVCTVTATLLDPINGKQAGGGAFKVTLINALFEKQGGEGKNNEFAGGSVSFKAFSSDNDQGEVDPLTIVYL